MSVERFLAIIAARKKLFGAVLGGCFLIALLLSLFLPKVFVGTVSVVINAKSTDPITGGAIVAGDLTPAYTATQLDIIQSHNVAAKVVDALKLTDDPQWRADFNDDTENGGDMRAWLAEKLLKKVRVAPSRESRVIDIEYHAKSASTAAAYANAFAEAYIQTAFEIKMDPARRQALWFDTQLDQLRSKLERAKQRLSEYQQKNNIVGQDERLDVENAKLAELSAQLVNTQTARLDAESRVHQLNDAIAHRHVEELPDILGNQLLQNMKADLVRAEGRFAQTASRYDHNHPEYINAAAEVDTLRSKLLSEVQTVKGAIVETARLAQQRENELKDAVEKQKQNILEMKQGRNEQDVLTREEMNSQQAYDAAVQRAAQVDLESQLDQANIAILNPALPPLDAKWPKPLLNFALAFILGSLLATGMVLMAEWRDRRVRSAHDLSDDLGIAVLGNFAFAD